jgi:hypothetical protein
MCSLNLEEEVNQLFEIKVISKIFRSKKDRVSEHFRVLHNEDFVIVKTEKSRLQCGVYAAMTRKKRNACRILVMKS